MLIRSQRERFAAPIAALTAAQAALRREDPDALASVRRIATRIQIAAANSGLTELEHVAAAVLEAQRAEELHWLIGYLIDQIRRSSATAAGDSNGILLVDDDRVSLRIAGDALREIGTVRTAASLAEASELLRQQAVALVVLDLVLPDADGRDLLVRLREQESTHSIPVMVLTGRSDPATHAECYALGADNVLVKPVHPDVLRSAVAVKLQQAGERQQEGRIDRLTGLPNRVAFFEALDRAIQLARAKDRPIVIAMIDIDFFKAVNDTYGHPTGDIVLKGLGEAISKALRLSDFVARWGGEEFCAFLPNTTVEGARIAMQKAVDEVRATTFTADDGRTFKVTFSAGLALLSGDTDTSSALAEADRLLYLAKAAGRDRVLTPDDAVSPPRPAVLLVDDDDAVARVVSKLLEREGFAVKRCRHAAEALEMISRDSVALAILDVGLPGTSGFDLLAELRSRSSSAHLPVLMLTGSSDEKDIVRGFQLGANDYVVKPFHPSELIARLKRLVDRR